MHISQNPRCHLHFPSRSPLHGVSSHNSPKTPNFRVRASADNSQTSSSNTGLVIVCSAITVILAVVNRVFYKLALVPLKQYPFFLAQFTTFGYVAIYFSILYIRYRAGIVTDEMIALPKSRFMAIGILEALGVASGMASAAMLPGPAIPLLNQMKEGNYIINCELGHGRRLWLELKARSGPREQDLSNPTTQDSGTLVRNICHHGQTFLVWQLALSTLILGRKYSFNQILGCFLVAAGVVTAVASGSNGDQMLSGIEFIWPALMIASSAFQAGASIIKEFVFVDAATRLKGKLLDIFVVNSFGSGFQALFVLLLLPLLSNFRGIPFPQLPSYLKAGAGCFLNIGSNIPGCDGAPLLPLLYLATNIAFNISLLNLVKISSAVVSTLAAMASVPISIYVLSLPLPYLPQGASLSPFFLFGGVILLLGLLLYNIPQPAKQDP
ncbi:Protein CLT2, chloroplastic [Vitis vinifera]|uniref:Protein CLT2, chloroplastic n=1 Tax=Vitis vinifera TaxID=29760 RepID=A0A438G0D4_VITVI|nr:Protein CLT2, chloroplastic [Vitis vinifera]